MSILSRLGANRHLDDDVLVEIWTTAVGVGSAGTHPHLASCAHCRARYSALNAWLEDIRLEAHAEADELMSPERLAAQQSQVLRRLEALERPARVIVFPKSTRPQIETRRVVPRWVPTAAAAGLVIGLATGQFVQLTKTPGPQVVSESASSARQGPVQPASLAADEALFYGDPETGVRSSTRYFPALDELTPRARDDFERPQ